MMSKFLTALSLILLLMCPALLSADDLRVQFIGNAALKITDGKTTVMSDFPYRSGAFGYMKYDFGQVTTEGEVLCLITHGHADHFEPSLFEKTNWKIIAPDDVVRKIDAARVVGSGPKRNFNAIEIEAMASPHANVEHYSYLVTWRGNRLYFSGDTESIETVISVKQIDVAFVTPWLLASVQKSGKKIDAASIVIYHHTANEQLPSCDNCRIIPQNDSFVLKSR